MKLILTIFFTLTGIYSQLNPAAAKELKRFQFIIGKWDCIGTYKNKDLDDIEYNAEWIGYYIMNGFAIADDFIVKNSSTNRYLFFGTTFRMFNKNSEKWEMRFWDALKTQWQTLEGQSINNEVHIVSRSKDIRGNFISKIKFKNITDNSFFWKSDRSYDNGKTWIKNFNTIKAIRRK